MATLREPGIESIEQPVAAVDGRVARLLERAEEIAGHELAEQTGANWRAGVLSDDTGRDSEAAAAFERVRDVWADSPALALRTPD